MTNYTIRPIRVLHVIPSVSPLRGGPSSVIYLLTTGLASQGLDVHVATTDDDGRERRSLVLGRPSREKGVTYWYFPRQTRFYTFSWALSRWLSEHAGDYDIVHLHALFSFPAVAAAYWARRHHVPYVVRPLGTLSRWGLQNRHPWLKHVSLRLIEGPVLASAAAVHFTSEQERVEASSVVDIQKPVVIPNPADFQPQSQAVPVECLQTRYPELRGKRTILFLSRLDPKKGIDLLLNAFASVRAQMPDTALVIAGSGEDAFERKVRRTAEVLGIASSVVWAGFLQGPDKRAALAGADLFVLPSYSENFGVAILEAMACGLPVVASDQVGIHREMSEAHAGLVVPCDKTRLAEAILKVLSDTALASELAEKGSAFAKTFSLGSITGRLIELYNEIAVSVPTGR